MSSLTHFSTSRILSLAVALIVLGSVAAFEQASAAVVVSDGFSGLPQVDGGNIDGRTPDGANLPGGSWRASWTFDSSFRFVLNTATGNPASSARGGAASYAMIPIATAGPYTKPTALSISADFLMNTIGDNGGVQLDRMGMFLGFAPDALMVDGSATNGNGGHDFDTTYSGLFMNRQGSLYLRENGDLSGNGSFTLLSAYPGALGTLSPSDWYRLSYDIDTSSGDISNMKLQRLSGTGAGTFSYADTNTTTFSNVNTNAAGFYTVGESGSQTAFVDNFLLQGPDAAAVPEPSTFILAVFGLAGLGLLAWRRRK
jgi:hypothetical protein